MTDLGLPIEGLPILTLRISALYKLCLAAKNNGDLKCDVLENEVEFVNGLMLATLSHASFADVFKVIYKDFATKEVVI